MKAKTLSKHLTQTHGVSKETYVMQFPDAKLTSDASSVRFKNRGQNFAWLKRAKERGDDLTEYKAKMGAAVSAAILANPKERARRSAQMTANNKTEAARQLSRNTAKRTSARPEIMAARAERLARWRTENFDVFYEKCVKAMHSTWHSKPELVLANVVMSIDAGFKQNQRLHDVCITSKSRRKQVDLANWDTNVIIEFDGKYHFQPIKGDETLNNTRVRDHELDEAVVKQEMTLIRISYDQFSYKDGGKFSDECLKQLFEHLRDPKPGVHRIGEAYAATFV